jgi:hypothetical protein
LNLKLCEVLSDVLRVLELDIVKVVPTIRAFKNAPGAGRHGDELDVVFARRTNSGKFHIDVTL